MLDGFKADTDEAKRQIYVALTRAKNRLAIHTNGRFFNQIQLPDIQRMENTETCLPPSKIAVQLTFKDVYLGHFAFVQPQVQTLTTGQNLKIQTDGLADQNGNLIVKFSKRFQEQIAVYRASGYGMTEARVNFLVYWTEQERGRELRVVLPEVGFELGAP